MTGLFRADCYVSLLLRADCALCPGCSVLTVLPVCRQSVKSAERAASSPDQGTERVPPAVGLDRSSPATLAVGVAILTVALLLAARLGIFQEVLYREYGRHSQQALFITVSGWGDGRLPLLMWVGLGSTCCDAY